MSSPASSAPTPWQRGLLLASLMLIALNLRPALSSLAPLLRQIEASTGLSSSAIGLLTTLPVLCLGLFAPLAPRLARRWGSERTLGAILALLACGIVLRSLLPPLGLFLGSLIAGASIGILGVLLPALVKRDFPAQAGQLMGLYTMMLCIGAAVAAGATAVVQALPGLADGSLAGEVQDDDLATYAHKLNKDEARLDWGRPAVELERRIRAFDPWPLCHTALAGEPLKVWAAELAAGQGVPGMVLDADRSGLLVACGQGALRLTRLQLPGGKPLGFADLYNARRERFAPGQVLGL